MINSRKTLLEKRIARLEKALNPKREAFGKAAGEPTFGNIDIDDIADAITSNMNPRFANAALGLAQAGKLNVERYLDDMVDLDEFFKYLLEDDDDWQEDPDEIEKELLEFIMFNNELVSEKVAEYIDAQDDYENFESYKRRSHRR